MGGALTYAPATVANLGVGFDVLGLAAATPGDRVRATRSAEPGIRIRNIRGDDGQLPRDHRNTAVIASAGVLSRLQETGGIALDIEKGLPLASGLGSSAASAVAAALATDALFGNLLSLPELLAACLEAEATVSGRHADNIAPALYGGIVLIRDGVVRPLPIPTGAKLALITPAIAIPTAEARALLPAAVPLRQVVRQTAAIAQLIDAFHRNDWRAAATAMEADGIIEPARAPLIPALPEARAAAKAAGALGLIISGAGPTLCALCEDDVAADASAVAVSDIFAARGISSHRVITHISTRGARLITEDSTAASTRI